MSEEEMYEEFGKLYPNIESLIEHYPLQAKYLWKLFEYDKLMNK
jgi:hypothetical protein